MRLSMFPVMFILTFGLFFPLALSAQQEGETPLPAEPDAAQGQGRSDSDSSKRETEAEKKPKQALYPVLELEQLVEMTNVGDAFIKTPTISFYDDIITSTTSMVFKLNIPLTAKYTLTPWIKDAVLLRYNNRDDDPLEDETDTLKIEPRNRFYLGLQHSIVPKKGLAIVLDTELRYDTILSPGNTSGSAKVRIFPASLMFRGVFPFGLKLLVVERTGFQMDPTQAGTGFLFNRIDNEVLLRAGFNLLHTVDTDLKMYLYAEELLIAYNLSPSVTPPTRYFMSDTTLGLEFQYKALQVFTGSFMWISNNIYTLGTENFQLNGGVRFGLVYQGNTYGFLADYKGGYNAFLGDWENYFAAAFRVKVKDGKL